MKLPLIAMDTTQCNQSYLLHTHTYMYTYCILRGTVVYDIFNTKSYHTMIVSWVSAHECLNITRDFGLHGHLPGIKTPYICVEAAATCTVPLEM